MATLQICYKDSSGRVVCKDSTVQRMVVAPEQQGDDKPKKKDVKEALDQLTSMLLAETPDYFAIVYAPDGVEGSSSRDAQAE